MTNTFIAMFSFLLISDVEENSFSAISQIIFGAHSIIRSSGLPNFQDANDYFYTFLPFSTFETYYIVLAPLSINFLI